MNYVLITPARNEAALIEATLRAVAAQTVLPRRWIIVSDGSTDQTDELVSRFAATRDWIELVRLPEHRDRSFAAKAACFNAGCRQLAGLDYDLIGNLDADITFAPDYFEFLLARFAALPGLGVAGTPFVEAAGPSGQHTYAHRFAQLDHVSGGCQLFRRRCFEEIGGYQPVKGGGIDWIAVTTARMNGWQTRTFLEKVCWHHRPLGTGTDRRLMVRFRYGEKAWAVGGHPLWELLRGLFQMRERPVVVGGLWFLAGYAWAGLTRREQVVSPALKAFHRREQLARLRRIARGATGGKAVAATDEAAARQEPRPPFKGSRATGAAKC